MATIKKREGRKGTTYLIRVSCGYTADGTQVIRSMSWKPSPELSAKAVQKELMRQAVLFEEQCAGHCASGAVKFETFARQWFTEYAEIKLRPSTVSQHHRREERTYAAIGHIRLDKLTPRHIQAFITDLGKPGASYIGIKSKPKVDFYALLKNHGMTQKELATSAKIGRSTVSSLCRGENITENTARKIANALACEYYALFDSANEMHPISSKTIRNYLSFISSVLGYAVQMGMIQSNPAEKVIPPPLRTREKECYSIAETQAFLNSLSEVPSKYRAFCVLGIYGGFRRGEILGLEWADIDFENHVLSIKRTSLYTKEKGVYTDTTKTAKSKRTLKLPESVFAVLQQHREEQAQERLFNGDRWAASDRLFVDSNGNPMHPNTPYSWLKKFCENTGQKFLGIHHFRHLNATLLINSGVDASTVSNSLGHSQTSTTLNIYTHTFEEAQAKAGKAVADALENRVNIGAKKNG